MTRKKCSALGEVERRTVCLVSGGDGGDLVRPAALPWSVTSSPGPWYCGHSTKPCRGHRERRLKMNVGVGLDVCVDVDVNEPLHDWEREKDRKRKEKGHSKFRKGGKRTTRLTGKNRDKNTQWVNKGTGNGKGKHLKIYTLNNKQQQLANLVMWLLHNTQ